MAQLLVRGLDGEVKARLKARAVKHRRSMEAEARDILRDALEDKAPPGPGLGSRIAARFADIGLEPDEMLECPEWSEPRNPFSE